jgi:hypothetical protein
MAAGDTKGLPLPDAPLRLIITDARAFDAALSGSYRLLLEADVPESDYMMAAWRRSRTGSKLEAEWEAFAGKFSINWQTLQSMSPSCIGLALLNVGHMEAVVVIETPLAVQSLSLPGGENKTHNGASYSIVARGAADGSDDNDSGRMGFAWAFLKGRLFLASSERAMKLALDAAIASAEYVPALDGLVSMELNLDELRGNLYFKREFRFPKGPETGRVHAALRRQGGRLVEVRRGVGETRMPVFRFDPGDAATAGWEPEGGNLWRTLRRALLDPEPNPSPRPQVAVRPLPPTTGTLDNYLIDFTKPGGAKASENWEEGDLSVWPKLLAEVPSYGYYSHKDQRRLVFPWPAAKDADFVDACRASMARRHGRATVQKTGDVQEIQVGPGLPALAVRRAGDFLWIAASAAHLKDVKTPSEEPNLVRWARLDLNAMRGEAQRWEKLEGPSDADLDRPLSDRVLGLLGWMPNTTSISVERKKTDAGWEELVVFGGK